MTWSSSNRKSRLPRDWHKRRLFVLERDHYWCQIRDDCCQSFATDCDHIVNNDDHSYSNLQAACGPCHRRKSAAEGHKAKPKRIRPRAAHPGLIGG